MQVICTTPPTPQIDAAPSFPGSATSPVARAARIFPRGRRPASQTLHYGAPQLAPSLRHDIACHRHAGACPPAPLPTLRRGPSPTRRHRSAPSCAQLALAGREWLQGRAAAGCGPSARPPTTIRRSRRLRAAHPRELRSQTRIWRPRGEGEHAELAGDSHGAARRRRRAAEGAGRGDRRAEMLAEGVATTLPLAGAAAPRRAAELAATAETREEAPSGAECSPNKRGRLKRGRGGGAVKKMGRDGEVAARGGGARGAGVAAWTSWTALRQRLGARGRFHGAGRAG